MPKSSMFILLLAGIAACDREPVGTETDLSPEYAVATAVEFDVQMVFTTPILPFLSFPDGRRHLDDFPGDLIVIDRNDDDEYDFDGAGDIVVSFRVDAAFFGHVWADMNFTTAAGTWMGKFSGQFFGHQDEAIVDLNMHGPDQQHLKASCVERQSAPNLLDCSGQILRPHG
jgi:hypothetical protein